jgi:hypothetical protein
MKIVRNAQNPDAASRNIKGRIWFSPLTDLQKAKFVLAEKAASGRDV